MLVMIKINYDLICEYHIYHKHLRSQKSTVGA
jgi:hypothetical protein